MTPSNRVVIVGAGNVGSSIAYSILNQELAKEIIMIDIATELVNAQVLDMQDAADFTHGIKVSVGDYSDIQQGDVIIITCGAAQKEGQTRLDLLNINVKIIKDVIQKIKSTGKQVYIVMVTNPVDILTHVAVKEAGLPKGMVFGSGTFLDSARLRVAIGDQLNVSPSSVHAYILGEHGDTSFPVLSSSTVGGMPLRNFISINDEYYNQIAEIVRDKAYDIIKGKQATYYGIGSAVARIVKSILNDENRIVPLSIELEGEYGYSNISIGVPAVLGANGAKSIGEIELDSNESLMFHNSVEIIKKNIAEAGI